MKNLLLSTLLLFAISQTAFAQKINGKVVSEKNNLGIPFASISYSNHSKGICADSTGKFEIEDAFSPNDSLTISCVGYFQTKFALSEASKLKIFALQEKTINLPEISVKKRDVITQLKGSQTNKTNTILLSRIKDNYEVALYIPNDDKSEGIIKNVGFFITKNGKPKTPFRVRIYAMNDKPTNDLLNTNIIINAKKGGKWLILDVSRYNISIPENGFVVSMEYLFSNNKKYIHEYTIFDKKTHTKEKRISYGQQIGITKEFSQYFGWSRSNGGPWTKYFTNPMIRSEVEIYR